MGDGVIIGDKWGGWNLRGCVGFGVVMLIKMSIVRFWGVVRIGERGMGGMVGGGENGWGKGLEN